VPAGGEMNADRSNKQYGMIDGEPRENMESVILK